MPATRKRALQDELDTDTPNTPNATNAQLPKQEAESLLSRIRNMWQFANLWQFMLLFGKPLKLDDSYDLEDLELECLKPDSMLLQEIGLGLLKFLSSHRGLTHESFDEYTRRQYISKAPDKNPFGIGEEPAKFADFDVFTKIRVLQQMTQFIMMNPDRLREKTEEQKDLDQTNWRIEPYGWDSKDRTYFVLDDNRIYRQTEAPPPPHKPKKNSKKTRATHRSNKRRRVSTAVVSDTEDAGEEASADPPPAEPEDDGLGGMKWECVAVTLDEVREFVSSIQKSRDSNERVLRDQIQEHLIPILEKQEESKKRKQLQREKEQLNLQKLAHAKRSSRIAGKAEQQKMDEQAREEERKRQEEKVARRKEEAQKAKLERERDARLMSRESRLKEREARRLQHEEELAQLSEDSKSVGPGPARMSERHRQAEIEKNREALREIEEEEDDWVFDCVCGVYGQVDDGTHSVACERCNVWQHSKCLGVAEEEAEQDDFHFVCNPCRRREQEEKESRPRIIKIKVNRPGSSSSPPPQKEADEDSLPQSSKSQLVVELPSSGPRRSNGPEIGETRGSPQPREGSPTELVQEKRSDQVLQPTGECSDAGLPARDTSPNSSPPRPQNNPFSSPHPNLSPPGQSPHKSRAYDSIFGQPIPALDFAHAGASAGPSKQAHSFNIGLPVLSPPAGAGNGSEPSPSKQSRPSSSPPSATKTSPAVVSTSREYGASGPARSFSSTPSASMILPQFTPVQSHSRSEGRTDERSSPLPPSRGGLSPTKQSPTIPQRPFSTNGNHSVVAAPLTGASHPIGVFPPSAALSPSPQPQILTPPVKSADPVRGSP
ncbi:hypothetical protein B0T17DRAFT_631170 [Bombardia bombarda]|uniref:Zinc finger PHD-type domain-containing protein n=1 Tax=Bombardia bombarda TaxID=252184 RepID=A0AA39X6E9_9PEZI|nr:hypothetical protein B0T17DRAFT_631170 [Bombardia bombarda]